VTAVGAKDAIPSNTWGRYKAKFTARRLRLPNVELREGVNLDLPPAVTYFLDQLDRLLLSIGSHLSVTSLISALCVSVLFLALKRYKRNRRIRIRTIARALFPRRIMASRSNFTDIGYLFFNVFVFGVIFGWAVLSYQFLSNAIVGLLVATFGAVKPTSLPEIFSRSVITAMLFLAYELGYWLNHYLSHRVPLLWEFHKVHHTATVLTPLTLFRVHPVYTAIFANILAIATAIASGLGNYVFGQTTYQYALSDSNIILVLFIHTYVHLQHTHLWIPFTGLLGRIFMSPAHHQVHHSTSPAHFNKNLGSCLAVWDWMFGTLYVPKKEPEVSSFGVEPGNKDVDTIYGALIAPIVRAAARIMPTFQKRSRQPLAAMSVADRKQAQQT
jgi:sterol desaturase/sphingolipid hydroxylase (fatty acid hydroxylase superfamily)